MDRVKKKEETRMLDEQKVLGNTDGRDGGRTLQQSDRVGGLAENCNLESAQFLADKQPKNSDTYPTK